LHSVFSLHSILSLSLISHFDKSGMCSPSDDWGPDLSGFRDDSILISDSIFSFGFFSDDFLATFSELFLSGDSNFFFRFFQIFHVFSDFSGDFSIFSGDFSGFSGDFSGFFRIFFRSFLYGY